MGILEFFMLMMLAGTAIVVSILMVTTAIVISLAPWFILGWFIYKGIQCVKSQKETSEE